MNRYVRHLVVALAVTSSSLVARAQTPNAGPDRTVKLAAGATMTGTIAGLSPLDWWTADGNHATENRIVMYSDAAGVTSSPILRDPNGTTFGWPSDLIDIGGTIYGIETWHRYLYTVDVATGACAPIGAQNGWKDVHSLAYDAVGDRLFGVDLKKKQLLRFNRQTGKVTMVGGNTLVGYPLIRALAYNPADDRLYAIDDGTDKVLKIHPTTGAPTVVHQLATGPLSRVEELSFHQGELFVSLGLLNSSGQFVGGQLQRLDLATGKRIDVGAPLIDVSPHSLVLYSVPELYQWSKVSGPGTVTFTDANLLDSKVAFGAVGNYVLALTVQTASGPVADTVKVKVTL